MFDQGTSRGHPDAARRRWPSARAALSDGWLLLALLATSTLALIDGLLGPTVTLISLYSIAPMVASLRLTPRRTALAMIYALSLGLLMGLIEGPFANGQHFVRLLVICAAGIIAIWLSVQRDRARHATKRALARESEARALLREREELLERERRARLRAEQAERRSSFILEAGMLLEGSLDYERTLENVARLAVPRVADWAFLEIVEDDGSIRRLGMTHSDPEKEALLPEYDRRYPVDPDAPDGSPKVIRTGLAELAHEIPDSALRAAAQDAEHLRILRELGFRSAMIVPLRARDRTLGALVLVSADSGRLFDEDDLAMAQELAVRCALAVDNARLYQQALASEESLSLDIAKRKELEAELSHQALHDALTGLPNRTLFFDRLNQALARSRRHGSLALLFFDLDRFKVVNDTLGHAAGDQLITAVAGRLRDAVRLEDTVGRFGGDEFVILCEDLESEEEGTALAQRVMDELAAPFSIEGRDLFVDASAGIVFARGEEGPDALLRDADTAMYAAKEHGRGRFEVFHDGMRPQTVERLAIEQSLRRAVESDGFVVVYQPVLDLASNTVAGLEALVRWDHPTRGSLPPEAFLPAAEESGLIQSIGAFVLEQASVEAVRDSVAHPDRPFLTTFVNVSPKQLGQAGLPRLVERIVSETGVEPGALCLEVPESVLMSDTSTTMNALLALKGLGVSLAVDDFGTGSSSLPHLRRFPINYLKIDGQFIECLGRRPEDSRLVAAMINMAHALGLTVIAEGVESAEQLAELRDLRCDLAQGHHIAEPRPANELRLDGRGWEPSRVVPSTG